MSEFDCNAEGYRVASTGWKHFWDSKERNFLSKEGTEGGYDSSGKNLVWPLSVMIQALVDGARVYPKEFLPMVKLAVPAFDNYYSPKHGMYCAAYNYDGNNDVYYDDNAQVATAFITAFEVTGDRQFLDKGHKLVVNIMTGWNNKKPYGMKWHIGKQYLNTCTTAESGICAMQLARHIHQQDPKLAQQLIQFGKSCCDWIFEWMHDSSDGLIWDGLHWDEKEQKPNRDMMKWTYNQGTTISLCGFVYEALTDETYLKRASDLAMAVTNRGSTIFDRDTGNQEARYYRDSTSFYSLLACGFADYLLFFGDKAPQEVQERVKNELLHTIKYIHKYMKNGEGVYGGGFEIFKYDERRYDEFKKLTGENKKFEPGKLVENLMNAGAGARCFFQTARVWPTFKED